MKNIFIIGIALLMLGTLSVRPASAQITYLTSTQLYRPGTQLNTNLGIGIRAVTDASFSEVAADGFTWIRIGPSWDSIEKVQGQYDWTVFDNICKMCLKYHLKPNWLVYYGNPLYGSTCTPAGITAFVNFARACAKESVAQGISGAHYEIWNEPENFGWLGVLYNQPNANILSASQIAQINNDSVGPIHAADPTALVCTSAFGSLNTQVYWGKPAFAGTPQGNPPVPGIDYNGAFDAIGLHQYSLGQFYKSTEGKNGNDNPECLMARNPSNLSADLYPSVVEALIPSYVPGKKTYWITESGRKFDDDCNNEQNYFSYGWVRMTLCQWMAGIQWQSGYCFDGDGSWNLQGTDAEKAMKFMSTKTKGRSIATMSYPSFSGTLPPANAIWSVTLTGYPAIRIVWVPEGSANVPVPAGWTATSMYGVSLSSKITNGTLPMRESSGVYYLKNSNLGKTKTSVKPIKWSAR